MDIKRGIPNFSENQMQTILNNIDNNTISINMKKSTIY